MALVLKDRVRQTSTTAGTGTITLSGSVTGYQDFTVIGTGNTTYYTIADQSGSNWEVGLGTYTAPDQLARTTVYESSNGNALVNFGSNIKDVFVTLPAEATIGGGVTSVSATSPVQSTGGTTPVISMPAATTSVSGYLTSTDWNTFNNKQAALVSGTNIKTVNGNTLLGAGNVSVGTVTSVTATSPVASTGGTTPVISMPAASSTVSGYLSSTDWNTFNSKGSGTVTAVSVVSANGLAGTSSGGATPALTLSTTVGTSIAPVLLKGNGTAISAATSGTDYAPATSGTSILYGNGTGGFSNVTIGSGISFVGGTLSATTGGGGTVTSVSVVSANGFAGTVATATTTPAITISTSVTGLLKGNGTSVSAATSGTDYAPATSGTSILYGNGAGGFSNVTIGSGLSFAGGTLSSTSSGGTITGSGTTNYISKFSSSTAIGNSVIYDDGTNIGVGTASPAAKLDVAGAVKTTGGVLPRAASSANQTSPWAWSSDSYDQQSITALANALTINADAGSPVDGQKTTFRIKDNGTARALTWTTGTAKSFRAIGVTLPTTTVISKTVYIGCIYNSADSRWDVVAVAQEA